MERLFAIGDIHGQWQELMTLMHTLINESGLDPRQDTVVFTGDYVDGGPDSKRVICTLMAWDLQCPHWVFLKGNHTDLMLDALVYQNRIYGSYDLWWNQGGRETAKSYLPEDATDYERAIMQPLDYFPKEHLDWLEARPLMHEQDGYYFVHAGFRPGIAIENHDREDMLWIRESFFTQRYNFGKPVVFGHTVFPDPPVFYDYRSGRKDEIVAIGIDTMFHNQGKLTAVELSLNSNTTEPTFYFSPAVEGGI